MTKHLTDNDIQKMLTRCSLTIEFNETTKQHELYHIGDEKLLIAECSLKTPIIATVKYIDREINNK